jgi:hypothetical protein
VSFEPTARPHGPELGNTAGVVTASTQAFETMEHGYLQLLAIHLVWHLHSRGAIQAPAANELLCMWHGARVGAPSTFAKN